MSEHLASWSDIALVSAAFHSDPYQRSHIPANSNSREMMHFQKVGRQQLRSLTALVVTAEAATTTLLCSMNSKRHSPGVSTA